MPPNNFLGPRSLFLKLLAYEYNFGLNFVFPSVEGLIYCCIKLYFSPFFTFTAGTDLFWHLDWICLLLMMRNSWTCLLLLTQLMYYKTNDSLFKSVKRFSSLVWMSSKVLLGHFDAGKTNSWLELACTSNGGIFFFNYY